MAGENANIEEKQLLSRKEAADYIGYKYNTLSVWHYTKRYKLKAIKIGRNIRYRKSDLDEFLKHHELAD